MKGLLRRFLISFSSLWVVSKILPALMITGGLRGVIMAVIAFMVVDALLVPLIKVLLLPLNLLTLGIFAWLANVLALYFLFTTVPSLAVTPYNFPGANFNFIIIPPIYLSTFGVVIVASLLIGIMVHFANWLVK